MSSDRIVVVGGGLAAATFVTRLRELGHDGPVSVFTDEPYPPYERPPLSKDILLDKAGPEDPLVHDLAWYREHDVELRTSSRVLSLERSDRIVITKDDAVPYDTLLLAPGARSRRMAMADDSGAPIAYLRTLEDSLALRKQLREGVRIGIVGGGWIGLEVAAAARIHGAEVTIFESAEQPLLHVLGAQVAQLFAGLHRDHGVDLRTSVTISRIERTAAGHALVHLEDAEPVECDQLVVGIGAELNTELASAAGLSIDDGIRADAHLWTNDPHILTAGDVANVDHPVLGRPVRVEHWDTAKKHGAVAARTALGQDAVADALPYFFTDQYDLGMEYLGSPGPDGFDQVIIRGDTANLQFTAWWLRGDEIVAGMQANDWDAMDQVRRLVGTRIDVERLGNKQVDLSTV
ncbi:MAG: NAD(P)/FAD-dependent oxidoreductase [Nocardioidaceae bacterium]|nr:MAG: NAD(P)/FAD-dependent oxidoreductase [Nocardioidaceae bacterium]